MAFTGDVITLAGLLRIDLPDRAPVLLCDGGFVTWNGDTYTGEDPELGTVESVDAVSESVGDEAPSGRLSFLPASTAAAGVLADPARQDSRVRFWLAQVDPATGGVIEAEQLFDGFIDTVQLSIGRGSRTLDIGLVSRAEKLFLINEGNVMSPRFHKSIWPSEQGFDNATGIESPVAWGVEAPPRGSVSTGGSGGGGGLASRVGRAYLASH